MKDPLINLAIQTNLQLIKQINRDPDLEGLPFSKRLLARGITVLQQKETLTDLERINLRRFFVRDGVNWYDSR